MTKPWRNITTIWSDKKNCVFVFISVNLTGDSTEKYFQADNLSVEQTEELLKIFANYVNAHKPNKLKNDQPNN